ncbi:MAG: bifunctional phosphoribosylaminoimidazolecarboxamide formyltransferase/IMP cyclohydrolase PurH [Bacteroidetes bacterium HGW-Bacteroidetes-8]|jgi:phosphoribosylaminoimidazolecarboxamide formyltransferase/IMP cyclohydrolase|nr:MAG: bifunctional phosphoribosylaminoimidazolecarboxamide formyltransferase/IMP cyclohydrolase PurH [Bacteroidetes bacterium HGW-Bacteroidetes-8]
MENRTVKRALISVYHKEGIDVIAKQLNDLNIEILSTGGTYDFIKGLGIPVKAVEEITDYPSILGGRVKTLHPKIFGGILTRRESDSDAAQVKEYSIPETDLVIVDLYPFEKYVTSNASHQEIIEKIDIGGISLIRAAAKNYKDVIIVPCKELYPAISHILTEKAGVSSMEERASFAAWAFNVSSHYDTAIFKYFNREGSIDGFKESILSSTPLRYGENPHQMALFYGSPNDIPEQIHGKEISYNNLLDIEAAIELISDFEETTVAILKHNNACGCASAQTISQAWEAALAADPVSAFGGIIIANREIDTQSAQEMNKLFFEVIIAPSYNEDALEVLRQKKNRIILINNSDLRTSKKFRSMLGGVLVQDRDSATEEKESLIPVTNRVATESETQDMIFANKIVKHSKSNAIVLAKNSVLISSGIGQTSRVDALKQAIAKAHNFGFSLEGSVMASDAFFPFPDCVEIAHQAGVTAVIQPGGSLRDGESIEYCNNNSVAMVITNRRHFKH